MATPQRRNWQCKSVLARYFLENCFKQLLDRASFAHLATLVSDGSPHSDPVWIAREADRVFVCTSKNTFEGEEHTSKSAGSDLNRRFR